LARPHQRRRLAHVRRVPGRLDAHEMADVAPEVEERLDLVTRGEVAEEAQAVARDEAPTHEREERVALADGHAPRVEIPLGMREEPGADEDVHEPYAERGADADAARPEPAGRGHVDPERGRLEAAAQ